MIKKRDSWIGAIVLAIIGIVSLRLPAYALDDEKIYKELDKFIRVLRLVDEEYVHKVKGAELIEGALQGMLSGLDPHSMYLPKEIFSEFKTDTTGKFGGVGIEITVKDGMLTIISPIDGTPASHAGLLPGDVILRIDGEDAKNINLIEAIEAMRGPIGESIVLTIYRSKTKKTFTVTLTREVVNVKSVVSEKLSDGLALIQIRNFQEDTEADFKTALDSLDGDSGAELKGLVIDLRNNPGGLLDQAVSIADLFIDRGPIVSIKDRSGKSEVKKATAKGTLHIPITVLVNEGSASASEILAGALQDTGRGFLIGEKTFGKGSVQTVIELPDGSGLKLTVAHYYTPKGRFIDGKGIIPNVIVDESLWRKSGEKEKGPQAFYEFQRAQAIRYLKQMIKDKE